jgi:hypothetical protein
MQLVMLMTWRGIDPSRIIMLVRRLERSPYLRVPVVGERIVLQQGEFARDVTQVIWQEDGVPAVCLENVWEKDGWSLGRLAELGFIDEGGDDPLERLID